MIYFINEMSAEIIATEIGQYIYYYFLPDKFIRPMVQIIYSRIVASFRLGVNFNFCLGNL